MLFAILDFEATSTDVQTARITEAAVILWDSDQNRVVGTYSSLIKPEGYEDVDPIVERLTGISFSFLEKHGAGRSNVLSMAHALCFSADYVVGHNIRSYDLPLFINELKRVNDLVDYSFKPIIDTRHDLDFPDHIDTRKLGYLALEHGIFAPTSHAATYDCLNTLELFKKYDVETSIANSKIKRIYVRADVSFQNKDLAKEQKYFWDGEKKIWVKQIKETMYEAEKSKCKFPVLILSDYTPK